MIVLAFLTSSRKIIRFQIRGKVVKYFDELWKDGIQIYPLHKPTIDKLKKSQNLNIRMMAALILDANKGKDLKEYESCKNEREIAEYIRKDCKSRGLLEIK